MHKHAFVNNIQKFYTRGEKQAFFTLKPKDITNAFVKMYS